MTKTVEECRKNIVAKPFSRDFDEQMDAANELYGSYLKFTMTKEDMVKEVNKWDFPYEQKVMDRVQELLRDQADKYVYMFQR